MRCDTDIACTGAAYGFLPAFSPDGKVLAVGTAGSVFLWDLPGGKPLRVLSERKDAADSPLQKGARLLQFSADGAAVFAFLDGKLQVWDDEAKEWKAASEPRKGPGIPTIDGPYYHAESKQLAVGQGFRNPFGSSQ